MLTAKQVWKVHLLTFRLGKRQDSVPPPDMTVNFMAYKVCHSKINFFQIDSNGLSCLYCSWMSEGRCKKNSWIFPQWRPNLVGMFGHQVRIGIINEKRFHGESFLCTNHTFIYCLDFLQHAFFVIFLKENKFLKRI